MRHLKLLFLGILFSFILPQNLFSQAPDGVNYQAVVRGPLGLPLNAQPVSVRFTIHQGSPTGPSVFQEVHATSTNQFGLINLELGSVNNGAFSVINWGTGGAYYLQIEVDPGSGYDDLGASQLLSVPYALFARSAATGAQGFNSLIDTVTATLAVCPTGGYVVLAGLDANANNVLDPGEVTSSFPVCNGTAGAAILTDTSATNELQTLNISNDTIFLTSGGFVVLPSLGDNDWTQGAGVVYNNTDHVGIGTATPIHPLTVVTTDTVVASFSSTNPNVAVISVAATNPNAASGIVLLSGADSGMIAVDPPNKTLWLSHSTAGGHTGIYADSAVALYGDVIGNISRSTIVNHADTIFNVPLTSNLINVNLGSFYTDSLSVLGNNFSNANWVLANNGFGQAVWTDPTTLPGGGGLWQSNAPNVYFNTGSVGIGTTTPFSELQIGTQLHLDTVTGPNGGLYNIYSNNLLFNGSNFVRTVAGTGVVNFMGDDEYGVQVFGNGAAGSNATAALAELQIDTNRARIQTKGSGLTILTTSDTSLYLQKNAGIGDPTIFFEANGQITGLRASATSITNLMFTLPNTDGNSGEVLSTDGAGNMSWITNGGGGLWQSNAPDVYFNTGNVGIGTTAPVQLFTLSTPGSTTLRLERTNAAAFDWEMNVDNLGFHLKGGADATGVGLTDFVNVDGNGRMGLGITTPTQLLHLFGGTLRIDNGANPYNLPAADGAISGQVMTTDAAGNVTWQTPAGGSPAWLLAGNSGTSSATDAIGTLDAQDLVFMTNGGERMRMTQTGRIGIGTTTPVSPLNVIYSGTDSEASLVNYTNTTASANGSGYHVNANNTGTGEITSGSFQVNASGNSTNTTAIDANNIANGAQNTGIKSVASGTGSSNYGGDFAASGANTTNTALSAFAVANGFSQATGIYATVGGTTTNPTYGVYGQNSSSTSGVAYAGYFQNLNNTGSVIYGVRSEVNSSSASNQYGLATSMATASAGIKYGVYSVVTGGATNWAGYFAAGDVYIQDNLVLPNGAGAGLVLTSDATGNASWQTPPPTTSPWTKVGNDVYLTDNVNDFVGIGTNSPTERLSIGAQGTAVSTASQASSDRIALIGSYWNGGGEVLEDFTLQNIASTTVNEEGRLGIAWTGTGVELMSIESTGDVGIGTTSPAARAHVNIVSPAFPALLVTNGNVTSNTAAVVQFDANSGLTNAFRLQRDGNIGIGTASPAAKLDVMGKIKITDGTEGVGNVLVSDASGIATWQPQINFSVNTSNTFIPSASMTPLVFSNVEYDNPGAFNIASGQFMAPVAGVYHIDATVIFDGTGANHEIEIYILRNGGIHKTVIAYANAAEPATTAHISADIYLPVSNTVSIGIFQNGPGGIAPTSFAPINRVYFNGHLVR